MTNRYSRRRFLQATTAAALTPLASPLLAHGPEEAIRKLRKLLGDDYIDCPVTYTYLETLLASTALPEGIEPRQSEKKGFFKKLFGK